MLVGKQALSEARPEWNTALDCHNHSPICTREKKLTI